MVATREPITKEQRISLPERWYPLRHHAKQQRYYSSPSRFKAVAAGRGSGKTEIAKRKLVRWLPVIKPWKDVKYFYAGPTLQQSKRIAWRDLKDMVPRAWIANISESELVIKTVFGSELHVLGFDKPHRAEGVQWDGGVIDENSDIKPKTFALTIRPALSHKTGWCDRIGVPKRSGCGAQEFKKLFDDPEWESFRWMSSEILSADEVAQAKRLLNLKDYQEQYEASWVQAGGLAFYAFDSLRNVGNVEYKHDQRVFVGADFNVNPMAWVLMHKYGSDFVVFDELFQHNTNTRECLDILWGKYGTGHKGGWTFCGDAASKARKTAASKAAMSDYLIIRNDTRFNAEMKIPASNPPVLDRLAATNMMLTNAADESKLLIHPRCVHLINDLSYRPVDDRGMPDEPRGDMGHITDALGYPIHLYAPLHRRGERSGTEITVFMGD